MSQAPARRPRTLEELVVDSSNRLDPLWRDRLYRWRSRSGVLLLRRIAAGALAVAAVVLALHPGAAAAEHGRRVVVAAHDLRAGVTVHGADVVLRWLPTEAIPAGTHADPGPVVGQVLVGPARSGEPITDVRVVGPANARLSGAGEDWTSVGVRLADPAVADLLRPGDHVDVVAGADTGQAPPAPAPPGAAPPAPPPPAGNTLALDAVVVTVRPAATDTDDDGRMVVLTLPRDAATRVAASALQQPVAVTLRET